MTPETTRKLKVIGGNLDGRNRVIVACRSMAEFCRLTGMSPYYAKQFACETANGEEVRKAMSSPGTAFKRPHFSGDNWEIHHV